MRAVGRALPWIGVAVRLGAAAIWLVAGGAKLADLTHFHAQVDAYKLLSGTPSTVLAYALPLVEVAIGLYLLVGLLVRPAAVVSLVLMGVFIVAMTQAWVRGLSLDCGCFGAVAREPVGLATILRDAAVGVPGLALVLCQRVAGRSTTGGLGCQVASRPPITRMCGPGVSHVG